MLLDHNLPTRLSRYEGFRLWLDNTLIACDAQKLYIPSGYEKTMDIKQREKEEIEQKISESLKRAKKGYGRLPFLFVYHDEWKDRKGYSYLGISTTWVDLNTLEMLFAAPCILHFEKKQTARNVFWSLEGA